MKKYLITLIAAASVAVHAHPAELAIRLEGYWKPDMEKTLALTKKSEREMNPEAQLIMRKFVFEFHNEKITVHPPTGRTSEPTPVEYKVTAEDKDAKTLSLRISSKKFKLDKAYLNPRMSILELEHGDYIVPKSASEVGQSVDHEHGVGAFCRFPIQASPRRPISCCEATGMHGSLPPELKRSKLKSI